jgi:hypothetical protein
MSSRNIVYIREFDRFDKTGNIHLENIVQRNVASNLRDGIIIIFTGIEFVPIYLDEIIIHVKSVKKDILTHIEENLQDRIY